MQPGATWGDILTTLRPLGLVPAITVTTSQATGGRHARRRLSVALLARLRKGGHLDRAASGSSRPQAGHWSVAHRGPRCRGATGPRKQRAFAGVIGGLGYLGAVCRITYRVLRVTEPGRAVRRAHGVRKYDTCRDLAEALIPNTRRTSSRSLRPAGPDEARRDLLGDRASRRKREPSALFFTSAFVPTTRFKPMKLHRPETAGAAAGGVGDAGALLWRLIWWWAWHFEYKDHDRYIDYAGRLHLLRGRERTGQEAVALRDAQDRAADLRRPQRPRTPGAGATPAISSRSWLDHTGAYFADRSLEPTLLDILWLPRISPS